MNNTPNPEKVEPPRFPTSSNIPWIRSWIAVLAKWKIIKHIRWFLEECSFSFWKETKPVWISNICIAYLTYFCSLCISFWVFLRFDVLTTSCFLLSVVAPQCNKPLLLSRLRYKPLFHVNYFFSLFFSRYVRTSGSLKFILCTLRRANVVRNLLPCHLTIQLL